MRTTTWGLALAIMLAACGSDSTGPASVAGLYRLGSVNGQPIPWVSPLSMGYHFGIEHGDLHLRANGSYGLGIGGTGGWLDEGPFRVTGKTVRLLPPGGAWPDTITATLAGDSVVVDRAEGELPGDRPVLPAPFPAIRMVFKRTAVPNPVAPGAFVLVAINGRTSLVEQDTVIGGDQAGPANL
jgi:hypothetical protein